MNLSEKNLLDILKDLKENHHAIGVKAEFETENNSIEEIIRLKYLASTTGLDLTIKIGGCATVKDLFEAKTIGAKNIVAPMIESPYAFEKYINAIKTVFSDKERTSIEFLINIETIYGYKYIDEILQNPLSKYLNGIVMGRTDMVHSLHMSENEINSDILLEYATNLASKAFQHNKSFILGGGISSKSIPFLKQIPPKFLSKVETRKIIFDTAHLNEEETTSSGISKAITFELMWIKNKQNYANSFSKDEINRIKTLENRF